MKRLVQTRGHAPNGEASGIAGYNPQRSPTAKAQKRARKHPQNSGTRAKTRFNTVDAVYGLKKWGRNR